MKEKGLLSRIKSLSFKSNKSSAKDGKKSKSSKQQSQPEEVRRASVAEVSKDVVGHDKNRPATATTAATATSPAPRTEDTASDQQQSDKRKGEADDTCDAKGDKAGAPETETSLASSESAEESTTGSYTSATVDDFHKQLTTAATAATAATADPSFILDPSSTAIYPSPTSSCAGGNDVAMSGLLTPPLTASSETSSTSTAQMVAPIALTAPPTPLDASEADNGLSFASPAAAQAALSPSPSQAHLRPATTSNSVANTPSHSRSASTASNASADGSQPKKQGIVKRLASVLRRNAHSTTDVREDASSTARAPDESGGRATSASRPESTVLSTSTSNLASAAFSSSSTSSSSSSSGFKLKAPWLPSSSASASFAQSASQLASITPSGSATLGTTGLVNIGNTCFMNSVLQCISNTTCFIDFFLDSKFAKQINTKNPLGTKGEVVSELASLVKILWSGAERSVSPRDFRAALVKFAPQFEGYAQHDAQEFLAFLMDAVHEDLNRIQKKPYVMARDSDGNLDPLQEFKLSVDSWKDHQQRNDSFVVDNLQGQLKSTIVCPCCGKRNVKFDPFMYLSLPLPRQPFLRQLVVTLTWSDPARRSTRFLVQVDPAGTIADLKAKLALTAGLPESSADAILITEVYMSRFHKIFLPTHQLDFIMDSDTLVAFENGDPVGKPGVSRIAVTLQEESGSRGYPKRFDPPLVLVLPSSISHATLYYAILHELKQRCWSSTAAEEPLEESQSAGEEPSAESAPTTSPAAPEATSESVAGALSPDTPSPDTSTAPAPPKAEQIPDNLAHLVAHLPPAPRAFPRNPLFELKYSSMLNDPLASDNCQDLALDPAITLTVEWTLEKKRKYLDEGRAAKCVDDESMKAKRPATYYSSHSVEEGDPLALDQCFNAFLQEESLGAEDAWYCSSCKKHQEGAIKRLQLWTLPDILIVHLKRFHFTSKLRKKIGDLVTFPLTDIDLTPYCQISSLLRDAVSASAVQERSEGGDKKSRGKKHDSLAAEAEHFLAGLREAKYDVYAICNHFGSLGGGHYTAYCKNHLTGDWYSFDDARVEKVDAKDVVTKSAYLLFLVRRDCASAVVSEGRLQKLVEKMTAQQPKEALPQEAEQHQGQHQGQHQETPLADDPATRVTREDLERVGQKCHRKTSSTDTAYETMSEEHASQPQPASLEGDRPTDGGVSENLVALNTCTETDL